MELIDQKDARILWNSEIRSGKITELIVEFFDYDAVKNGADPDETWPLHLYKKYRSDIGNCQSSWDKWTPFDILMAVVVSQKFVSEEVADSAFDQLLKIKEFRAACKHYRSLHLYFS